MSKNQTLTGGGKITSFSLLKGFFAFAILFCVTSCYKDDISNLQSQIDQLKAGEIATIDSQIKAINTSITDLKKVDETINGLVGELQKDGEKYAGQIADLQAMDGKLDEKIADLQGYTDEELAKQKDWVEATFATLDQLDSLCAVVTGVDAKIDSVSASLDSLKKELVAGYEESIEKAVTDLETSMKKWVNDQLADYYTIAQTDAALKALEEKYDKADEDLKKEIDEQKTALENSKKDITEAYKKAIEEAITAHDGIINDKIAKDIASAKKELQDQIDVINTEITNIKTKLDALEKELEELARRPQSIVVLAVKPIVLSTGEQASIEFRVNPSTAVFDYSEENCQIELDKAGTVQTKASYVTKPQNYKLVKIEQVVDEETQEVLTGQYRAVIEDTGRSAEYDEMVALVLNTKDAKGKDVQISSSVFEVIGKNYDNLPHNGLPVVMINTPNAAPIVSKDDYVEGSYITLLNADMTYDYQGEMKIKGRGNSTWGAPKKPYKVKFDKKQSLYGEPKDKEWVLLANYYDKSMLRSDVAYWMASTYGQFDYVPKFHFVDLMLNGQYNGTYQVGDQVKIAKDRVNVGDDGFLLEIDARATTTEDITFRVSHIVQPINIKDPDVVVGDENYNYVSDFVARADAILYSENWLDEANGYKSLIDMQSFVEWYLVMEITKNADACFFSSCYMNLSRNGKLRMGPLWDFDISIGGYPKSFSAGTSEIVNNYEGFYIKNASWINRMFNDPKFIAAVKDRFGTYYKNKGAILAHIENIAERNKPSAVANNGLWGTLCDKNSPEYTVETAYDEQVAYLKNWLSSRLEWLKSAFDAM